VARRTRRRVAASVRKSGLAIPAIGSLYFSSHVVETKMDEVAGIRATTEEEEVYSCGDRLSAHANVRHDVTASLSG
jgi:hypothetical protein